MSNYSNVYNINIFSQSILHKKIYLKYHQKNDMSKNKEIEYIKSLIQGYIKKNITSLITLKRTWLCIKIVYNDEKDNNIHNNTDETNDSQENLIKLFTLPGDITEKIESYLKQYDKYIEIVNDNKDEYLIDLTSYIINNKEKDNLEEENNMNLFLHRLKIEIEQKFNINIFIGKGNNILLASLACLKCFVESIKNKNNESIVINDINDILEDNDNNEYLISVRNDENSILSFMNKFPLEYLSMSDNKYFINFLTKKIDEKNFPNIKNLGDINNKYFEDIYNIFNKDYIYKDIFLFCLGIGEPFHKSQIIINNGQNLNEIEEKNFKNKTQSQIIEIYIKLADKLFKQIFFYHYNPKTLIIILINDKNKMYKRVTDKSSLFNNKESLINIGIKVIEKIFLGMSEDNIKSFIKIKIYFDNIVKFDNIERKIWEDFYSNQINEIRIKNSKNFYWNNFLNSKSKDDSKNQSKSYDNNIDKNSKQKELNKINSISSKSINNTKKVSKKTNLDILGFNKKRKKKNSKISQYLLLAKNKKLDNYMIENSKEMNK